MKKVVRDGKVAVVFSEGYGAGWYTMHGIEELLFDPNVVAMVEKKENVKEYCKNLYKRSYFLDNHRLAIEWVPEGVEFKIVGYDGLETIEYKADEVLWFKA